VDGPADGDGVRAALCHESALADYCDSQHQHLEIARTRLGLVEFGDLEGHQMIAIAGGLASDH